MATDSSRSGTFAGDADTAVDRLIEHYRMSVEIALDTPISLKTGPLRLVRA